jgi:pilin isopeptide linkage protein
LSSDSNPSYKTGDFRVNFYDFFLNENHDNNDEVVFNESIMKSTFCEKSTSGTSYDFTVDRSLSDVVGHSSDNEETIIHNLKFTVTNSKKPAGKLDLTAHKTVNDGEPGQDDYFTFYLKDENGNILQTKQNDSDGNIKFDPINYNLDDIGKEFTYQVEEMKGSEENVTYDSSIYTVKVTPYQDPNDRSNIIADPAITKDGEEVSKIAFNNAVDKEQDDVSVTVKWDDYTDPEALDVTMSYSGAFTLHYSGSDTVTFPDSIKVYYGDEYCGTAVKSESISDQIRQAAALRKYVSGKINSGSGSVQRGQTQQYSVSLDLPLHYDSYDTATKSETIHIDPKKFSFSADGISLNNSNKFSDRYFSVSCQDLIDLDTMENSTFNESSASGTKYDFSVTKDRSYLSEPIGGGATMTTHALNFTLTNSLKSAGALRLKANKTVNNGKPDQSYTFNLLDQDGNILQTKQNDPDGTIKFDPIHYDSTDIGKEYTYQVLEKKGSDKNTAYDSSVYTVKVTPYRDPDDPYTVIADPVITKDGEEVSEITFNNKVDNRKPVKTGDSSKTILWAIVLISAAAAFSIALRKREHE